MASPARRTVKKQKAVARERISLGLKVTEETKQLIDKMARDANRTQSQQCEYMIEKCLQYDRMLESMRTTLTELETGSVEAALFRRGCSMVREIIDGKVWKSWMEPGHPRAAERSGFEA